GARAPAVAAALFAVAELGFWSLERTPSHSEGTVLVRRLATLAAGVVLTAFAGSLLLVLTTGVTGGGGLEAAGGAAARLALRAIVRVGSRAPVLSQRGGGQNAPARAPSQPPGPQGTEPGGNAGQHPPPVPAV